MELNQIGLVAAFAGGVVSFLSPCVLPLLPTFSALLAGTAAEEADNRGKIYVNTLCFLAGFVLVFTIMGATASLLGQWFFEYQPEVRKIGAVLIILMGLCLSGLFRLAPLEREYRPFIVRTFQGPLGAFLLGLSFTVGWTPCTGPVLASILLYAGGSNTAGVGALLLFIYAMGFSLPFFVMAVVLKKYLSRMRNIYRWLPHIQRIAGYILIVIGIFIWLDWLQKGLGFFWSVWQ
ncbi:cytochrome c biogenesis protein transmembrane region [Lucifera butyrica]|uniref:Cytochrome c biogenesis protein transmembrane region n=1 Tax=Lucifera butyrica TaxID=1351585 RepID=A0A498RAM3_9FIRM|nr:cytochrome c biogenesis protein CcdA [Lucifera butyrica]VBB08249.1 cytochrome c biogenesis protein transmembrane region [Lucifera butyrica]